MQASRSLILVSAAALFALAGCATSRVTIPADLPAPLKTPAGQAPYIEALATGVQIYECAPKPGDSSAFAWTFRAPETALTDRSGRPLGKHYSGPTWESLERRPVTPGPLLERQASSGSGRSAESRPLSAAMRPMPRSSCECHTRPRTSSIAWVRKEEGHLANDSTSGSSRGSTCGLSCRVSLNRKAREKALAADSHVYAMKLRGHRRLPRPHQEVAASPMRSTLHAMPRTPGRACGAARDRSWAWRTGGSRES